MLTEEILKYIALVGGIFLMLLSTAILLIINKHHKYKRLEREIIDTPAHLSENSSKTHTQNAVAQIKTASLELIERIEVETIGPPEPVAKESLLLVGGKAHKNDKNKKK